MSRDGLLTYLVLWLLVAVIAAPFIATGLATLRLGGSTASSTDGPSLEWWASWWLGGSWMRDARVLLLSGVAAGLFVLLVAADRASSAPAKDGGQLGEATVIRGRNALRRASDRWDGTGRPDGCGLVYGYDGRYMLYESSSPHSFVDSATGSGKTRRIVIPTIALMAAYCANMVVCDVKGELLELLGDGLERRGYDVLSLDLQHPRRGDRFNPISQVVSLAKAGRVQDAQTAASTVAQAIVPDEGPASSHWVDSARGLITACILVVAFSEDCPDEARTLYSAGRILNEGTEGSEEDPARPFKDYLRSLPADHPARAFSSQVLSTTGNEQSSIISTAKLHMRPFMAGDAAWVTSGDDIDVNRVLTTRTALFLHVLDEGSPYNALCAMLFDQLYRAVDIVCEESGGSLPIECDIIGDEWGNLPRVASLAALTSLGRSKRLRWHGFVQNVAQLNKYGRDTDRQKILANCGIKVAIRLSEAEDCQYFSDMIGKTTRHVNSSSRSRGGDRSTSSSGSSEMADYVIHPWEWRDRTSGRDGVIVVKAAEEGAPRTHSGVFESPVVDATMTPACGMFDLGSREHEAERRRDFQRRRILLEEERAGEGVPSWCPEWPHGVGAQDPDSYEVPPHGEDVEGGIRDEFSDFADGI